MKRPWKTTVETARQSEVQQPSPTRSKSNIRSMKDRISGPIQIATPIDAGIPRANEAQNNNAEDDTPSLTVDNDTKPDTPVGGTPEDQRDTKDMWAPRVSPQHVKVAQYHEDDGAAGGDGDGSASRVGTPSGGGYVRQPSKNARMSYFSADSTNNGYKEPQKKKSALRGAIGRLFGRKKKAVSQASTWETGSTQPTPDPRHPQAEVVPEDVLQKVDVSKPEHKRSVSMPVSEKDRALRSHSIGLKDRLAIESARDSLKAESNFSRLRPGTQSLRRSNRRSDELSGLTPRPASASGNINGITVHIDDPRDIGRAISSDNIEPKSMKRRSRSLTALAIVENEHVIDRSRSGEIRYWRASYDPEYKSPLSSSHPEQDDEEDYAEAMEEAVEQTPAAPPEPFNFPDPGIAGMKITAAASLETRISRLEDRTQYLWEHFEEVNRYLKDLRAEQMSLGTLEPMDKFLDNTPSRIKTKEQRAEDKKEGVSTGTLLQEAQSVNVENGSAISTPQKPPQVPSRSSTPLDKTKLRPDSTATIRGVSSLPLPSKDLPGTLTIEHYTTLIALLDTERSARLALEAKVKTLDHQVNLMRNQSIRGPSMNNFGDSKASFGGSAFDDDSEESEPERWRKRSGPYQDEDEYSAAYATPHDPDTTDDEVMGYKKSDRTLSLSQMTMQSHKRRVEAVHEPLPGKQNSSV